jgi:hypothetical protein
VGRAKGIALLGAVKFLRRHRDAAQEALPPQLHGYLDGWVEAAKWYPGEHVALLLRAIARVLGGPQDQALQSMGEWTVRAHAEIYGELLTGRGSSSRVFALWGNQYDSGELKRVRETPGSLRFELSGYQDTSREQCLVMIGYLKGTIALAGLQDAEAAKVSCRLWGDPECVWRVTWKV